MEYKQLLKIILVFVILGVCLLVVLPWADVGMKESEIKLSGTLEDEGIEEGGFEFSENPMFLSTDTAYDKVYKLFNKFDLDYAHTNVGGLEVYNTFFIEYEEESLDFDVLSSKIKDGVDNSATLDFKDDWGTVSVSGELYGESDCWGQYDNDIPIENTILGSTDSYTTGILKVKAGLYESGSEYVIKVRICE